MVKRPSYNPTVPNTNTTVQHGSHLESFVGRENVVATTGAPTTSDAWPTSGRVAADTSTSPHTFYIGDGSSWVEAELGTHHNPDTVDIAAANTTQTASGGAQNPYVVRVNSSGGNGDFIGFDHPDAVPGMQLVVLGASGITNTVTIKDNNSTATNAFQTTSGSDQTVDAASDNYLFVFDGTDWAQHSSGAGN